MSKDFSPIAWDTQLVADLRHLTQLAVVEDLDRGFDWTTLSLVDASAKATARVVARQDGVLAGLRCGEIVLKEMACQAEWIPQRQDSESVKRGDVLAHIKGAARDLLTAERTILNFLGRLSGVATLTALFVQRVQGTHARIYDTRKTLPGWRRLEKYAVRCGGGYNHRSGLYDAVLIKDNHICQLAGHHCPTGEVAATAVQRARQFLAGQSVKTGRTTACIVEIEIDSLAQLRPVLTAHPDIVLLDNFGLEDLRQAVEIRNAVGPEIILEASGGVTLATVCAIAETGVDRISTGSITHSAPNFDVALDWDDFRGAA